MGSNPMLSVRQKSVETLSFQRFYAFFFCFQPVFLAFFVNEKSFKIKGIAAHLMQMQHEMQHEIRNIPSYIYVK